MSKKRNCYQVAKWDDRRCQGYVYVRIYHYTPATFNLTS